MATYDGYLDMYTKDDEQVFSPPKRQCVDYVTKSDVYQSPKVVFKKFLASKENYFVIVDAKGADLTKHKHSTEQEAWNELIHSGSIFGKEDYLAKGCTVMQFRFDTLKSEFDKMFDRL
jgi:hypothetical protein